MSVHLVLYSKTKLPKHWTSSLKEDLNLTRDNDPQIFDLPKTNSANDTTDIKSAKKEVNRTAETDYTKTVSEKNEDKKKLNENKKATTTLKTETKSKKQIKKRDLDGNKEETSVTEKDNKVTINVITETLTEQGKIISDPRVSESSECDDCVKKIPQCGIQDFPVLLTFSVFTDF